MSARSLGDTAPLRELLDQELARELSGRGERASPGVAALLDRALGGLVSEVVLRPGKGVRARLVQHAFAIGQAGRPEGAPLPPSLPLALEVLHAGSLVIDDIQDGADERRGAPALHRTHGVALALNAGNWLYFWALSLVGRAGLAADVELGVRRAFEDAVLRCHAGQALDLSARVTDLPREAVADVVASSTRWKTGALFALATAAGAIAARASAGVLGALTRFGEEAGVALQMADDVSSVLRPSRRGKAEEDLRGARPTWPWVWAAEALSGDDYRSLQADVAAYRGDAAALDGILARLRPPAEGCGKALSRRRLDGAFSELRGALSPAQQIAAEPLVIEVRAALEALHGQ